MRSSAATFAAYKRDRLERLQWAIPDHHHLLRRHLGPVRRARARGAAPSTRRCRTRWTSATRSSPRAGMHGTVVRDRRGHRPGRDRADRRRHARPPRRSPPWPREIEAEPTRTEADRAGARNLLGTPLTYRERVVPALESRPGPADRPRPRRRGLPDGSRVAAPPRRLEGARPTGRPRGRPQGAAAEGPQADRGRHGHARSRSCASASTGSASKSPEIRREGSNEISVELAGVHDPAQAAAIVGKTGQLGLYDLIPALVSPSVDATRGHRGAVHEPLQRC